MEVGDKVKNILLKNHEGKDFDLYDIKGKRILLSFHPLAWTGVCQKQMESLEENYGKLRELNILPVGISVDTVPSKKAWAKEMGLEKLQLLSDFWPHGEVAKRLGIFIKQKGVSMRVNILLDKSYNIIWKKEYEMSEVPDLQEIFDYIEEIKGLEK